MGRRVGWTLGVVVALVAALWLGGVFDAGTVLEPDERDTETDERSLLTAEDEREPKSPELQGTGQAEREADAPIEVKGPRITGVVVDESGRPVSRARVFTFADTHDGEIDASTIESGEFPGSVAWTNDAGRFVVGVSTDAPFHHVAVSAKGFGATIAPGKKTGSDVRIELERAVTLTGRIRSTEGEAVPGAKVRAWLLVDAFEINLEATADADGRYQMEGLPPQIAQVLGETFPGFYRKNWFEVRGPGHAPLLVEDVRPEGTGTERTKDFTLSRGATLTGRVTDAESGKPIAGANVLLYSIEGLSGFRRQSGGGFSCPFAPRTVAETKTDEHGEYTIAHVPCRGAHRSASHNAARGGGMALGGVVAWTQGYSGRGARLALPDDGAELEASLELWPAARIKGRVVTADGTPLPRVSVSVKIPDRGFGSSMPKDLEGIQTPWTRKVEDDGSFLITGAPAPREGTTEGTLVVYPYGPRGRSPIRWQKVEQPVRIHGGEVTDVGDVLLGAPDRSPTTTLIVHAPGGAPFFGATVSRGNMGNVPRTDAEGRVEWVWWKPTEKYPYKDQEVVVRARGYAPTVATLHPPGSGKETVTVTLAAARRIAGRVLNSDGTPAAHTGIHVGDGTLPAEDVFPASWGAAIFPTRHNNRDSAKPLIYGTSRTDAEGRFDFADLPEGPYHVLAVTARRVSQGPGRGSLRALQSGVEADTTDVELRLPADDSPPVGTITGSIIDPTTNKVPEGVQLRVMRGTKSLAFVFGSRRMGVPGGQVSFIDDAGAFVVKNVPIGMCEIKVNAAGYRSTTIEGIEVTEAGTTAVPPIKLDKGVTVSGRAQAAGDISLAGRQIVFEADGVSQRANIGKNGSYRVGGLAQGSYTVTGHPERWGPNTFPLLPDDGKGLVIAKASGDITHDVTFVAGAWLVLSPLDKRLPPAQWSGEKATKAQTAFGAGSRVHVTGPDGKTIYEHEGVSQRWAGARSWLAVRPGRYTARLEMPGGESREEVIDLEAKAKVEVHFK